MLTAASAFESRFPLKIKGSINASFFAYELFRIHIQLILFIKVSHLSIFSAKRTSSKSFTILLVEKSPDTGLPDWPTLR
jgi:hypothetical protein